MPEVLALVFIALLLFGAKRIPELMKSMGKGVRSFKEGMNEIDKEINSDVESSSKHSEEEKKD